MLQQVFLNLKKGLRSQKFQVKEKLTCPIISEMHESHSNIVN